VKAVAGARLSPIAVFDRKALPHFRQKLTSAGLIVWHEVQRLSSLPPHFMQKSASAGLSKLHLVHCII